MITPEHPLDPEELLHLAMQASLDDRHDQAIAYLKRVHASRPNDAVALYLLGSAHVQIGMVERGMDEISRALEIQPGMEVARLQLGLMRMSCGQAEWAREVLEPLAGLPETHCMHHFARGLLSLMEGQAEQSRAAIERGIMLNPYNMELNRDMARIADTLLDRVEPDAWSMLDGQAYGGLQ